MFNIDRFKSYYKRISEIKENQSKVIKEVEK